MSAIWHVCGTDDPAQDKIVVWLAYEDMDARGHTHGIRVCLAVYTGGHYKMVRTKCGDENRRIYGQLICWSYVMDTPSGPPLVFNGERWTMGLFE